MTYLEGIADIDMIARRFEAWYDCEIIDRPPVTMWVAQNVQLDLPTKRHASHRDRRLDVEFAVDWFEALQKGTVYMADSFPVFWPNVGPEVCATVFGAELEFSESTSWSIPIVGNCRDILNLKPSLDNVYWNSIRQMTDLSLERGTGKWITALTDFHTNGDLVAALRNPQGMCLDIIDDPSGVRAAVDYVTESYPLMYNDLYDRLAAKGQSCCLWGVPASGRMYVTNCDFICMISPQMFEDVILPALRWEMNWLDRTHFHLDGPGALKHLDRLLELRELSGIQWVYGAGQGSAGDWLHIYKKIQAAGKCIECLCGSVEDARTIMANLKPQGIWFNGVCVGSVEEGEAFLKDLERWAAGK